MWVIPEIWDIKLTLPAACIDLCESECYQCIDWKDVCDQCKDAHFTSYVSRMRPSKRWIECNLQCVKWVVMILTSDCEKGNRQCLSKFRKEIEQVTIDSHLSLLSALPDCSHVLKSCI